MKGLSTEIKFALNTIIEGLNYNFFSPDGSNNRDIETYVDSLEAEKMKKVMDSKISSFNSAKKILDKWITSPNSPDKTTIVHYLEELIEAGENALGVLRKGLAGSINYDELDPSKHDAAIKAKPIILESIFELDSAINELRIKLESDDFSLSDKEFKLGYPERFAKGELLDTSSYWKTKLKGDDVLICPFSTEGEKMVISDLGIILPKPPKDKSKILFSDLPKKEQYWRRPELPIISPDNVEAYDEFIKEEFRRRVEGIWFMNNGKPVYLTGNHYFALTYFRMLDDGDFMKFRYAQLKMFYHLEACIVDPRCLGQLFGKSRRTGFTYVILAILLNHSTMKRNNKLGLMSKTGTDGQEAFLKYAYALRSLPFWFKPIIQGKEDSPASFTFSAPADNSKEAKKQKKGNVTDYLNTTVDWRNTTNGSYDSIKLNFYLLDECFDPSTKILTEEGFKEVSKVKEGDFIVNSKGHLKKVVGKLLGQTEMFEVIQPYGKNFKVTGNHKLYVDYGSNKSCSKKVFMSPYEYFELPEHRRRYVRTVYADRFEYEEKDLPIPPYLFGLWLGDGVSKDSSFIVNMEDDKEIMDYLREYAEENGFELSFYKNSKKCHTVRFIDRSSHDANQFSKSKHKFIVKLKELGVFNNKHIPEIYLKASVQQRLELLAGIIDSDGYLRSTTSNGYNIGMSREHLVKQIYTLSKELGLSTSNVKSYVSNFDTDVFHVAITDYDAEIPCKVLRKQPKKTKKVNRRNKLTIEYAGIGDYVGITVEGDNDEDKLLVLEDYTATKNCFKIEKPNDIIVHMGMIRPTMMPSGRVVGKMFAGSTMGQHNKGGEQGIELINNSYVKDRDPITKKTTSGLYFHFLPAQENMEEFTDIYGYCHTETPPKGTLNVLGEPIEMGSIEYLLAVEEQLRKQSDAAYNEQLRTYPRTVEHMMRDESGECAFNLAKIIEQEEHNQKIPDEQKYIVGNFDWVDGVDSDVEFFPNPKGRFKVAWLPSKADGTEGLKNRVEEKNGLFYPLNKDCVRFGCDPFSLKSTHGEGSKGAIHGKTIMFPEGGAPSNKFVVEYIARPSDETVFFEDVIKVIRYYGAPILVESNRIDLLRHMRNRGYRPFSMNRLDRPASKLNDNEKEYGGQPMSGKDILDSHMNGIGAWIERYVGVSSNEEFREIGEMGEMPFNETLKDWRKFDPDKRTKYDATISSGLAIMACSTEKYKGTKKEKKKVNASGIFRKYSNKGNLSKHI